MDETARHPQFRNNGKPRQLIENRQYKCVYLPRHSPELNQIEQFLAIAKDKVRCSQFGDTKNSKPEFLRRVVKFSESTHIISHNILELYLKIASMNAFCTVDSRFDIKISLPLFLFKECQK